MAKLLAPNPHRIPKPAYAETKPDAVSAKFANGSDRELRDALADIVGDDNVQWRVSDLVRFASDASPYRDIPSIVVQPRNAEDLAALMRFAKNAGRTLTFRSAGTSLNGQAMTDDILVDVKTNFAGMEVLEDGARLRCRPGVVLGDAQAVLRRHGYMLGPDPGSTASASVGGVVSTNAGGMRCKLERDSYHTIDQAVFVLTDGTIVDTRKGDDAFKQQRPDLHEQLIALRDRIRGDEALVERLRKKFSIRNTNGLRIDAFLDEDEPVRILMRLLVGSEGILGVFTEVEMRTIELPKKKAVTWVVLPDIRDAANYVAKLVEAGAEACELLVSDVMKRSVGNFKQAPEEWADIDSQTAALLLEVGGVDEDELKEAIEKAEEVLQDAELLSPLNFETDAKVQVGMWELRSGLFGLIGENRRQGTALITEDVCFPPADIGEAASELMDLLKEFGYPDAVMGHAPYGNLHFFLTPNLANEDELSRYAEFLDALTELVVDKYDGSMKAEHGTGINMAPFVPREWGEEIFGLFWEVKNTLDPDGILAPDVKLTRSTDIHLQRFKSFPKVEAEINACVECGFCEPVCPSRHVTVTPRQRIVLRREMARQPEGSEVLDKLREQYQYDAIDMCAADGTCAIPCPVGIDTGKAMKQLRAAQATRAERATAKRIAEHYDTVETLGRTAVAGVNFMGPGLANAVTKIGRTLVSPERLPSVPGPMPQRAPEMPDTQREGARAVYFPACVNRIFGRPDSVPAGSLDTPHAVVELGRRSGAPVWIPENVDGECCGMPFSSKGFTEAYRVKAISLLEQLWEWSDGGELPVIVDAASCSHTIIDSMPETLIGEELERFEKIRVLDVVEWLEKDVLEHLEVTADLGRIAVHPPCSGEHLGTTEALFTLADACGEAAIPEGAACCGTAGDRVMLHPELVESATREEREGLEAGNFDCFVSANRTCEMGLEMVAGKPFESIAALLERASRPKITLV
ncbi:FAD-binding oxidoreductase [Corynebacterium sp. TA-R-1]|uniref:D-lactate dehydrogenase (cytochrome) n=1 Tax=Corynebacterium stercoris TaxID=2943490 RepID=A0ABT1FZ30_9CORY|nr:FAD-binding and (Fe-S)-binding domain-containing protein [Corynebacterium stercoris]MCP1387027.1 FAD-binding oxidoreductase [Corynebacterium stercoris]